MDTWDESSGYDDYMGRWSQPIAREFLSWLDLATGTKWVDVGCGTGELTTMIAEETAPAHVAGIDPSAGFIDAARRRLGAAPNLRVGDAQGLTTYYAAEGGLFQDEDAPVGAHVFQDFRPHRHRHLTEVGLSQQVHVGP